MVNSLSIGILEGVKLPHQESLNLSGPLAGNTTQFLPCMDSPSLLHNS